MRVEERSPWEARNVNWQDPKAKKRRVPPPHPSLSSPSLSYPECLQRYSRSIASLILLSRLPLPPRSPPFPWPPAYYVIRITIICFDCSSIWVTGGYPRLRVGNRPFSDPTAAVVRAAGEREGKAASSYLCVPRVPHRRSRCDSRIVKYLED